MCSNKISLLLLLSILTTGCINNTHYRKDFVKSPCPYVTKNDCPTAVITEETRDNVKYNLSFIEFDDQGGLFDEQSKKDVMNMYQKKISDDKEIIMLTFIHGWNHNANGKTEDDNIIEFRKVLRNVARIFPNKEVLGLYIGWSGRSLPSFLNYVTFWNRKATAQEIGQKGFTTILLELEHIIKGTEKNKKKNRMITIGHSFGAAALYSSLKIVLLERYIKSRPSKDAAKGKVEGFGDLVLLMNPAFEAMQYHSLYNLAQDGCNEYYKSQLPKLIILSAEEDKALKWTFPIGRIPSLLQRHRKTKGYYCDTDGRKEYEIEQWEADIYAIGHNEKYVTHYLTRSKKSSSPSLCSSEPKYEGKNKEWWLNQRINGNEPISLGYGLELAPTNNTNWFNPYMNIMTKNGVMAGHNDIWNDNICHFILSAVSLSIEK